MGIQLTLAEREIHVWYTLAAKELETDVAARYLALLAPAERDRHDRFVQEKDRRQYLLGKVLVRTVLSLYLKREPEDWIFATNNLGKPVLANGPADSSICFNLSHTDGLVVCAVARNIEVGIDVENISRKVNLDLAQRYFAPVEVAYLDTMPKERLHAVFFLFWTLKEAYIKARGLGLTLPLDQFAFCLENLQAPKVTFEPATGENPSDWRFYLPEVPSKDHQVAVAARSGNELTLQVAALTL
jgi:4'-phosphopantetheinyl transferase